MRRLRHVLPLLLLVAGIGVASAESGYQTIQGTRVFTEIDHEAGVATFSNDCGRQKLTQSELQGGAIPTDIIPCPRDGSASNDEGSGDDPEADALFREGLGHKQAERWYEAGKVFGKAALRYGEVGDNARDKTIRSRNLRLFAVSNCLSSLTTNLDMLLTSGVPTTDTYGLEDETCRKVEDTSSLVQEIERKLRAVAAANAQRTEAEAAQRQAEAKQRQAEAERPSDERCAIGIGTTKRVTCVSPGADCECLSFGNTCPYPVTITYQVDNFPTRSFELEGGKTDNGSACSTRSGQRVSYVRFRPWAGYPKAGQPQAEAKIETSYEPEPAAVPNFAAYAANSEFGGGLGHGATEQEAVDEALRICRGSGSTTCVKHPAVTADMSKVFATACCRAPRFGCATAVGVSSTDAALTAKDILKRAKFTDCETSSSIRAGVK